MRESVPPILPQGFVSQLIDIVSQYFIRHVPLEGAYREQMVSRKPRKSLFTLQIELQFNTLVVDMAKIIRIPFLNMTFMTFQERACILQIHGLNLKGREVGGTTLHPNKEKDLFPVKVLT